MNRRYRFLEKFQRYSEQGKTYVFLSSFDPQKKLLDIMRMVSDDAADEVKLDPLADEDLFDALFPALQVLAGYAFIAGYGKGCDDGAKDRQDLLFSEIEKIRGQEKGKKADDKETKDFQA